MKITYTGHASVSTVCEHSGIEHVTVWKTETQLNGMSDITREIEQPNQKYMFMGIILDTHGV